MARTSYIIVPPGMENIFNRSLTSASRFLFPRLTIKRSLLSYVKLQKLTQRSLLPIISAEWEQLTTAERDAWKVAAEQSGTTAWRLFVSDMTWRKKLGLIGVAIPSVLYQVKVGKITLVGNNQYIKLAQYHPQTYWTQRKVSGSKSKYEPVLVREDFALPLTISINYKSLLVQTNTTYKAKYVASVMRLYQGRTINEILEIPFDLVTDWKNATATISQVIGQAIGYTLFIELENLQGTLFFDNVKSEHGGQNWVRDTVCNSIDTTFTKAFYQIPRNWAPVVISSDATYESLYYY